LADNRLPVIGIFIASLAIHFKVEMSVALHVFILHAANNVHKVTESESFVSELRRLQNEHDCIRSIETFSRMHTVVAHSAVLLRVFFAEVVKQLSPAANRGFSVVFHLLQKNAGILAFLNRFVLVELLELVEVVMTVKHQTQSLQAIATCTTGLLIISLK